MTTGCTLARSSKAELTGLGHPRDNVRGISCCVCLRNYTGYLAEIEGDVGDQMKLRRRRGATLGFVAIIVLVIAILGVAFFVMAKMLGGGREIANAVDAGVLNVAKIAIRTPAKDANSFSNPDVAQNFALLGESPRNLDLLTYNRLVAQSILVALNAKEEGTLLSAQNARKVWIALKDVASFIRTNQDKSAVMGSYFDSLSRANNIKMLGNNSIDLSDYGVSFMKRGASTNIWIDPAILATVSGGSTVPINSTGHSSASGKKYMAGYVPMSVSLPATADSLTFAGVPVGPGDRPHLVKLGEFQNDAKDDFIVGKGAPAYPPDTLPPNSYKASGISMENHSHGMAGAIASAIVGCLNLDFEMQIPYGYIEIINGPRSTGSSTAVANFKDDIFNYELAHGIWAQGTNGNDPFTTDGFLYLAWQQYNTGSGVGTKPDVAKSLGSFKRVDGAAVTEDDLKRITMEAPDAECLWAYYDDPMEKPRCLDLLDAFKAAYNRPGSTDSGNVADGGFTTLEQFKSDVLRARVNIRTCATAMAPTETTGVKWFQHNTAYSAPTGHPYNFSLEKSAYEYLEMIDEVSSTCGTNTVFNEILRRAREIVPSTSKAQLQEIMKTNKLPLGARQYIFRSGSALICSLSPPPWMVPGVVADGASNKCGEAYPVIGDLVNTESGGDGGFFDTPFGKTPNGSCSDVATWVPSSGYNNCLGSLSFSNSCTGGGKFCKPN